MTARRSTDAAVLKQLRSVTERITREASGERRLALLRRQAALVDQRDANEKARRAVL